MVAIHRAEARVFLIEVISLFDGGADEHVRGHLSKVIELLILSGSICGQSLLELIKHDEPFSKSVGLDPQSEIEGRFGMPNGPRVGSPVRDPQHHRVIIGSQPSRVIASHEGPIIIHCVGHADGIGDPSSSLLKSPQEGSD